MQVNKLYLDLDGVLSDFDEGVRRLCNLEYTKDDRGENAKIMWEAIRDCGHFYEKLVPMEGAVELVNRAVELFGGRVEILSAVPKDTAGIVTAKEDKIAWVQHYFPMIKGINIVSRSEKKAYCNSRADILIDDFIKNVEAWEENGGTGILFTNAKEAIKAIEGLM